MQLNERIELTRITLDALEKIEANKGIVPEGFVLEFRSMWSKEWSGESVHVVDGSVNGVDSGGFYRLQPKGQQ